MKNFNDTIGNQTRDIPACSASASTNCASSSVPQLIISIIAKNNNIVIHCNSNFRAETIFKRFRKFPKKKNRSYIRHASLCPSVLLSICPSACNNSAATGRILMKISI